MKMMGGMGPMIANTTNTHAAAMRHHTVTTDSTDCVAIRSKVDGGVGKDGGKSGTEAGLGSADGGGRVRMLIENNTATGRAAVTRGGRPPASVADEDGPGREGGRAREDDEGPRGEGGGAGVDDNSGSSEGCTWPGIVDAIGG